MPASKGPNMLSIWGNEKSMNLNPMILTNIQNSPYFKVQLLTKKTYHEVIDEIYYKVDHLEPWERGSRKTAGQTGMCGGVRGVGTGGIVSTAWCILYKLYTLRLTRKQVVGLMNHADSPYIRALGFLYVRLTQAPQDLLDWYEEYLEDDEEIDVKAGGGCVITIGEMLQQWISKLEWYSTMFPRIPVPVSKQINERLAYIRQSNQAAAAVPTLNAAAANNDANYNQPKIYSQPIPDEEVNWGEAEKAAAELRRQRQERGDVAPHPHARAGPRRSPDRRDKDHYSHKQSSERHRSYSPHRHGHRSRDHSRHRSRDRDGSRHRSKDGSRHRSKDGSRHRSKDGSKHRSRDRSRHRSRSRDRSRHRSKDRSSRSRSRSRSHGGKRHKHHKKHKKHKHKHRRERHSESHSSGSGGGGGGEQNGS